MITILQQNPTTLSFVLEVITTKRKETYIQFKEHNTTSFYNECLYRNKLFCNTAPILHNNSTVTCPGADSGLVKLVEMTNFFFNN